jgi:hypothetical protein
MVDWKQLALLAKRWSGEVCLRVEGIQPSSESYRNANRVLQECCSVFDLVQQTKKIQLINMMNNLRAKPYRRIWIYLDIPVRTNLENETYSTKMENRK